MSEIQSTDFLAKKQIEAILSQGECAQEILHKLLCKHFHLLPTCRVEQSKQEFDLFDKHTNVEKPKVGGLYLKLLHGRTPADMELDDWGEDGPWIGPLKWFHCTYMTTLGIGFSSGEEFCSNTGIMADLPSPIYISNDMIYFGGVYYGDWELQLISG